MCFLFCVAFFTIIFIFIAVVIAIGVGVVVIGIVGMEERSRCR